VGTEYNFACEKLTWNSEYARAIRKSQYERKGKTGWDRTSFLMVAQMLYPEFQKELASLINKHSMENESNTPDFILLATLLSV